MERWGEIELERELSWGRPGAVGQGFKQRRFQHNCPFCKYHHATHTHHLSYGITFARLMRSNASFHVSGVRISSVYPALCEASMLIWRSKSNIVMMKYYHQSVPNLSFSKQVTSYLEPRVRNITIHTPLFQIMLLLQLIPLFPMPSNIRTRLP
jgi:hypothetical protein